MKRILTSIAVAFAALAAQAQVTATYHDVAMGNDFTNVTYDFWVEPNFFHEYHFDIQNISNSSQDYKMHKVDITMNNGASAYFCLIPGNCYAPVSPFTSPVFTIAPSGMVELLCDFSSGANVGESSVRYTLINDNNGNDTIYLVMNYHVTPAGINSAALSKTFVSAPSPNPASSTVSFSYRMVEGANNTVAIYNTLGDLVREISISEIEGNVKLDVADLTSGIYFASFRVNSEVIATRKVLVTR